MKKSSTLSRKWKTLYCRAETITQKKLQPPGEFPLQKIDQFVRELLGYQAELETQLEAFRKSHRRIETIRPQKPPGGSGQKYRMLVDNAANGIVVTQDGKIKFVNLLISRISGYSESELISRPFVDLVHPDDRQPLVRYHIDRLKGEQAPATYAFRVIDKNGAVRWVENNVSIITWDGKPATLNFLIDITQRKHAEIALQESRKTIQALIDATPETMLLVDTDGKVLAANEIAAMRFGLEKTVRIGRNSREFFPADAAVKRGQKFKEVLSSGKPLCFAEEDNGRHYHYSLYPVFDAEGKVEKVAVFAQDLTLKRQTELALRESEERYRQLFENESDAVMVFDAETLRFEDANKATLALFGYAKEEFLTLTVTGISAEKLKTLEAVKKIAEMQPGSDQVPIRYFIKKNGEVFPGEIYAGQFSMGGGKKIIGAVRDITKRIRARDALRESEARYRALSEATFEAIFISEKGVCIDTNQRASELFGYEHDELIGIFGTDVIAPESKELVRRNMLSGFEKPYEAVAQKKDGARFFVEIRGKMAKYKNKDVRITVVRDITEQKLTMEALKNSERRYRNLFNSVPIGLFHSTPQGDILDVNSAMVEVLGYPDRESLLKVKSFETYVEPDDRIQFQRLLEENGAVNDFSVQLRRHDAKTIWVSINARIARDAEDGTYYEGSMADITRRKEAEAYIHQLSHQLIRAQENERRLISRELHDGVAQDLAMLKITSDMLFANLRPASSKEKQKMTEFSGLLQHVITTVRGLAYDLRPPALDGMGLVRAVSMFCEEFAEKSGVRVEFSTSGVEEHALDSDTEINIYRLIQEGLNNIRKHASASLATVKLLMALKNLVLLIEDNGRGFDVAERIRFADHEKRMGLRSMKERVCLLQGRMEVQSRLMKGTRIIIKIPLREKTPG
jgi:PAS domain S-box-containing protein